MNKAVENTLRILYFITGVFIIGITFVKLRKIKTVYGTVLKTRCDESKCSTVVDYIIDKKRQAEIETTRVRVGQIIKLEYSAGKQGEVKQCCIFVRLLQLALLFGIIPVYIAYSGFGNSRNAG